MVQIVLLFTLPFSPPLLAFNLKLVSGVHVNNSKARPHSKTTHLLYFVLVVAAGTHGMSKFSPRVWSEAGMRMASNDDTADNSSRLVWVGRWMGLAKTTPDKLSWLFWMREGRDRF